jgi:hypothetical protein
LAGEGDNALSRSALAMWDLQTEIRPNSPRDWPPPSAADRTRRFLIDSERRVISHCGKLLEDRDLLAEERHRLTQLLKEARTRVQFMVSPMATEN